MSDRMLFGFAASSRVGFTPPAPVGARRGVGPTGEAGTDPRQVRFGRPGSGGTPGGSAEGWRVAIWGMLRTAWRRHRTRHCLLGLEPYLLKDIGISSAEAEAEANKPFWVA